jgi:hypothetical protein
MQKRETLRLIPRAPNLVPDFLGLKQLGRQIDDTIYYNDSE